MRSALCQRAVFAIVYSKVYNSFDYYLHLTSRALAIVAKEWITMRFAN